MDYLRVCYRSLMRLYPDRPDVLTLGQWHFCPEGAQVVPYQHMFGSRSWDPNYEKGVGPVGEVRRYGKFARGETPPQFDGKHLCGTPSAWLGGIPFADRPGLQLDPYGYPMCCASTWKPTYTAGQIQGVQLGQVRPGQAGQIQGVQLGQVRPAQAGQIQGVDNETAEETPAGQIQGVMIEMGYGAAAGQIQGVQLGQMKPIAGGQRQGVQLGQMRPMNAGQVQQLDIGG